MWYWPYCKTNILDKIRDSLKSSDLNTILRGRHNEGTLGVQKVLPSLCETTDAVRELGEDADIKSICHCLVPCNIRMQAVSRVE